MLLIRTLILATCCLTACSMGWAQIPTSPPSKQTTRDISQSAFDGNGQSEEGDRVDDLNADLKAIAQQQQAFQQARRAQLGNRTWNDSSSFHRRNAAQKTNPLVVVPVPQVVPPVGVVPPVAAVPGVAAAPPVAVWPNAGIFYPPIPSYPNLGVAVYDPVFPYYGPVYGYPLIGYPRPYPPYVDPYYLSFPSPAHQHRVPRRSTTPGSHYFGDPHASQYFGNPHASQYFGDPHASQYMPR